MLTTNGNLINMALTVQQIIEKYKDVWSNHTGFTTEVEKMNNLLELIQLHQKKAERQTQGVTLDKSNAADYAIKMGLELAGAASIYAKKAKSETLKKAFKISKRNLYNVQGIVTLSRLKDLYDNLEAVIDNLQDNVTKEELASFKDAINDFEAQIVNPRAVIIDREKSNKIIADSVKELKSTFEDLDNLMPKFKKTEFEKEYKPARIVIDHGKGGPGKGGNDELKDEGPDDGGPADINEGQ